MKILSLSSLITLLTICSLSAQNPTLPPPPNEPPLQVPAASDDLIPPLPETITPTPVQQAVPKTPPANPIPVPEREIPKPSQFKSTTPPEPQSNPDWQVSPERDPRYRYGISDRQTDREIPSANLQRGVSDPRYAPHFQPMYNTYDPYAAQYQYYGAHSWSHPMVADDINPEGAEGIFVGPAFSGGLHVRFPYYSYRRPWYTRGPASLNVDIIW